VTLDPYLVALSRRQAMMLLSALTHGGRHSLGIFDHLPEHEAELLRHRAQEILKIPRKKRVSLLVRELKRLITARREQPWARDPERLGRVLRSERPALVEVVLRALPAETAEVIRGRLPAGSVRMRDIREVKPPILQIVRWKLEEALAMRVGHPQHLLRLPAVGD
jgi:flagellar motor switch protein FliG